MDIDGSERLPRIPMVDVGVGDYISEQPSTRFPVYTRGNAGEVWPEVVYPLSIGLARGDRPDPYSKPLLESGLVTAADVAEGITTMGGVFGGYMYLNLSINRVMAIRTIGGTIDDSDAIFLGSRSVAPPHRPHPDDTDRSASLRGARYGIRILRETEVPHLLDDRAFVGRWQERLPALLDGPTDGLVAALRELVDPTLDMFSRHVEVTGKAGVSLQLLTTICDKQLGDRSIALTLLAGLGEIDSAAPSFDLWRLGRLVATDRAVTAQFDRGLDGLARRLADDPDAAAFNLALGEFRHQYASRGPNEWETASETWGTDATLPLALIDRMRLADADHDPARKRSEGAAARLAAAESARTRLRWPMRWLFDRALRAARLFSPARERSKTIIVDLIHVSRLITREVGRRCADRVGGGDMNDVWFVFPDELDAYVADPGAFTDVIARRRSVRDELSRREPPFVFDGELPPADSWPLRDAVFRGDHLRAGEHIVGLGGCSGVAEGIARIVTDPSEPGDLGPGDVLVAPLTDPAWTPLFVPVEAIVVDVGGQMSHAVIVSRELGRPCVVAATGATKRIRDGARIRVDGGTGTVTVLDVGDR